jgi:hypothetical protein
MRTSTVDTLKYVKQLESAGLPSVQAEAFVNAQAVKMEVKSLDQKMDSKFALVDAKMDKLVWMIGILVALAAANFAKQYF